MIFSFLLGFWIMLSSFSLGFMWSTLLREGKKPHFVDVIIAFSIGWIWLLTSLFDKKPSKKL